jgi:hypothetical protein
MSYDLAVWEGKRPRTNAEAQETLTTLLARYQEAGEPPGPTDGIRRYVEALLVKFPELDDDNEDDCPWSDSPLIRNATGPLFYFSMAFSHAEIASAFAAQVAKEHGLVCFDPQSSELR